MEEMTRREADKIWENLTIADNFIFQKVMRKKRLCKRFIEKVLHIKLNAQTSTLWTLCARP